MAALTQLKWQDDPKTSASLLVLPIVAKNVMSDNNRTLTIMEVVLRVIPVDMKKTHPTKDKWMSYINGHPYNNTLMGWSTAKNEVLGAVLAALQDAEGLLKARLNM